MKEIKDDRYNSNSLIRGLEIIKLFNAERPSLSLAEIAKLLDVSRTVPYRLLYTLESVGYLRQQKDTKRYELTPKVLELGYAYLNSLELTDVAQPYLDSLRDKLNVSCHLSTLEGSEVVYIGTSAMKGITALNVNVGLRLNALSVANGRILLAHQPEEYVKKHFIYPEDEVVESNEISGKENLLAELKEIRNKGYAVSKGEFITGINSVAVPIYDFNNEIVAALNVVGIDSQLSEKIIEEIALPIVNDAARSLSNFEGCLN